MSENKMMIGKVLRINLTNGKIITEKIDSKILRKYMGGKGLAAYYLFKELKKGIDPLSPENEIIFMNGPLTGTMAPASCRFVVATKSPLSGTWDDASSGGFWGPELRFAGYDGIIIEGKAEKPVYIQITDDQVQIREAGFLWGMGVVDTINYIREQHKSDRTPRVAAIGPAGEKMARIAAVIADMRAAGRGGVGAVMGSKNLKAISVVGHNKVPIADSENFRELAKKANKEAMEDGAQMSVMGTAGNVRGVNGTGGWPTKNYSENQWHEAAKELVGDRFQETLWGNGKYVKPCFNCSVKCSHLAVIREGKYAGVSSEGPEYETITMFGPNCGINSREVITVADKMCDDLGLDTISTGNAIGFIMECMEKGLIKNEDIDGLDLRFGNADAVLKAIRMAGNAYGKLGSLLANGVKRASEKIGKGSEKFAMHVKGLELPAYAPRSGYGVALAYAVADRGGCHNRPWMYGPEHYWRATDPAVPDGKAKVVKGGQEMKSLVQSSGLCQFGSIYDGFDEDFVNIINYCTGFNYTSDEFKQLGERINNLTHSFNAREGFTRKDDTLPYRSLNEPMPLGPSKGRVIQLDKMLDEYYALCGWNENGVPTKEKLKELGLDFAIGTF